MDAICDVMYRLRWSSRWPERQMPKGSKNSVRSIGYPLGEWVSVKWREVIRHWLKCRNTKRIARAAYLAEAGRTARHQRPTRRAWCRPCPHRWWTIPKEKILCVKNSQKENLIRKFLNIDRWWVSMCCLCVLEATQFILNNNTYFCGSVFGMEATLSMMLPQA